jgi:ComF family protein
MGAIQRVLHMVYPPQCIGCGEVMGDDGGLCGPCWRDTAFITGLVCDRCGTPLPGDASDQSRDIVCDECLKTARPWHQGRAVFLYKENGRRMVLGLKHGDRTDMAAALSTWMARTGSAFFQPGMVIAPVPLHWRRLFKRRYNQSALLAENIARLAGMAYCPDLLQRNRATPSMEGKNRDARFENVARAISAHPRHKAKLNGKHIVIVDDVLTSGATFAACTEACLSAGADHVSVLALARVNRDA